MLYTKAMDITVVNLGPDHPDTIKIASELTKIEALMASVD
jgi:hypothetical protein